MRSPMCSERTVREVYYSLLEAGWSYTKLAHAIGASPSTTRRWDTLSYAISAQFHERIKALDGQPPPPSRPGVSSTGTKPKHHPPAGHPMEALLAAGWSRKLLAAELDRAYSTLRSWLMTGEIPDWATDACWRLLDQPPKKVPGCAPRRPYLIVDLLAAGWTQTEIAEERRVSQNTVSGWLSGKETISDSVAEKLIEMRDRGEKRPLELTGNLVSDVARILRRRGWSTRELAERVGVSTWTIQRYRYEGVVCLDRAAEVMKVLAPLLTQEHPHPFGAGLRAPKGAKVIAPSVPAPVGNRIKGTTLPHFPWKDGIDSMGLQRRVKEVRRRTGYSLKKLAKLIGSGTQSLNRLLEEGVEIAPNFLVKVDQWLHGHEHPQHDYWIAYRIIEPGPDSLEGLYRDWPGASKAYKDQIASNAVEKGWYVERKDGMLYWCGWDE